MKNLHEFPPEMLRTVSLDALRMIYASTVELRDSIRAEAEEQRKFVFKGRLLCLAMVANVAFVLCLTQGSLSQNNDFFLYLNCFAIAASCTVFWRHAQSEFDWRDFRRMQAKVTQGAQEMREALDEIERAEREAA